MTDNLKIDANKEGFLVKVTELDEDEILTVEKAILFTECELESTMWYSKHDRNTKYDHKPFASASFYVEIIVFSKDINRINFFIYEYKKLLSQISYLNSCLTRKVVGCE
jgi:hypothetical protein